jgi:hypothetical protein
MEPIAHVVWVGCGLSRCSAASAFRRYNSTIPSLFIGSTSNSLNAVPSQVTLLVQVRAHARYGSLRHAGFDETLDEHITMRETAQVAAQETDADRRADPVPRLDEEARLFG